MIRFRPSVLSDIPQMAQIAREGRELLKSRGISQWQRGTYPDAAVFQADIRNGIGYVLANGEEILAVCAITTGEESSYRNLTQGSWLTPDGTLYAVIHRSAVSAKHQGRGLMGELIRCVERLSQTLGAVSIRVDTHEDNHAMQRVLERAGFCQCCRLLLTEGDEAGDPRLGYEKLI